MLQLISFGNVELQEWLNRTKGIIATVLANVIAQIKGLKQCKNQMVDQKLRRIIRKFYLIVMCKFASHSLFNAII